MNNMNCMKKIENFQLFSDKYEFKRILNESSIFFI